MKIIRRGEVPENKPFQMICHHCKTIMELTESEMKLSSDQRDPGLYIDCPVCKKTLWRPTGGQTDLNHPWG